MKRKLLVVGFAAVVVLLCVPLASGQAALEKRISLDVNAVPPADVFGSIARTLGCGLEIHPDIKAPVTVRLSNVTARTMLDALCDSILSAAAPKRDSSDGHFKPSPKELGVFSGCESLFWRSHVFKTDSISESRECGI
jgi:hypothetical protein